MTELLIKSVEFLKGSFDLECAAAVESVSGKEIDPEAYRASVREATERLCSMFADGTEDLFIVYNNAARAIEPCNMVISTHISEPDTSGFKRRSFKLDFVSPESGESVLVRDIYFGTLQSVMLQVRRNLFEAGERGDSPREMTAQGGLTLQRLEEASKLFPSDRSVAVLQGREPQYSIDANVRLKFLDLLVALFPSGPFKEGVYGAEQSGQDFSRVMGYSRVEMGWAQGKLKGEGVGLLPA